MAPPDRVFNSPQQSASWTAASAEIVKGLVPERVTLDPLHHDAGHDPPLKRVLASIAVPKRHPPSLRDPSLGVTASTVSRWLWSLDRGPSLSQDVRIHRKYASSPALVGAKAQGGRAAAEPRSSKLGCA